MRRVSKVGISEPKPQILMGSHYHALQTSEKHNLIFSISKTVICWLHKIYQ